MQDTAEYEFKAHERPTMPGSPANPDHPRRRRLFYFLIGILIGITGGLGNALITVNINFAQGTLGLYTNESAWLTAAYFMTNTTANLFLVKYRQQFGLSFWRKLGHQGLAAEWRQDFAQSDPINGVDDERQGRVILA